MMRASRARLVARWLALGAIASPLQAQTPRHRSSLDDGWRFAAGPIAGAEATGFVDSAWTPVTVPHTWNAADAFAKALGYRRGVGWYRRRLTLDPSLRERRVFLHFEGANQVADVFVNGRAAGRHVGGYTAFTFDVTSLLRPDSTNVIAVRVDNTHDPDVPPLDADFTFYGGLYRDVWLVATDPIHVTMADHGSTGVYVDATGAPGGDATVRVRATIDNATRERRRLRVVTRILDEAGREVATARRDLDVGASGSAPLEQRLVLRDPRRWSPETPSLYAVHTEVLDGARLVDRVVSPLGVRTFDVDAQRGFLLDGRPYPLHGTNRHQDRAGFANALPDWAHRADVATVKQTGFNFLRLAHYPQDPAVLEAADRLGLVLWEEVPVVNRVTMSDAFEANAETMLVEMIRQHYNHPSVAFWGYMNEVMLQPPSPLPAGYREHIVAMARRLDARAHREDSTRHTATAISQGEIDNGTGYQEIADVLGLNLYFGWYGGTMARLGPFLDALHATHPSTPLFISEYGADSDERIHSPEARAFDFSADYQQRFHEETLPQLLARPWLVGTAVWNQFDFGAKNRHDSKPNLNQKGLHYFDRTPKDVAYYYRASLDSSPVLHIATRDWSHRAGSRAADRVQPVRVYTNAADVELFVGDSSLGTRRVAAAAAEWQVPMRDGANVLRARAVVRGRAIDDLAVVQYDDREPFFRDTSSRAREIAVNAGSHYSYTDAAGVVWEADRAYTAGGWGRTGGAPALIHHRIFGSDDDPLYQAALDSARGHRFDVPDGEYEVRLRFVETTHDAAGRRVFDAAVNGVPVAAALDLAAEYGRYVAVERAVRVSARGGAGIAITFTPRIGAPIVSGILVRRH